MSWNSSTRALDTLKKLILLKTVVLKWLKNSWGLSFRGAEHPQIQLTSCPFTLMLLLVYHVLFSIGLDFAFSRTQYWFNWKQFSLNLLNAHIDDSDRSFATVPQCTFEIFQKPLLLETVGYQRALQRQWLDTLLRWMCGAKQQHFRIWVSKSRLESMCLNWCNLSGHLGRI